MRNWIRRMNWNMGWENLTTGPYIWVGRTHLFVYNSSYRGPWRSFGFDSDGAFAIVTPWFTFHPW
jgi:hypothetical protein